MKNTFGKKENLELFNKNGVRVYKFYIYPSGDSYESTYDKHGRMLTDKNSDGYSREYTYDKDGNELTCKITTP